MTDSIQWYYYADAAPPAPPRAPCNDRTHAGAVFEGTPFSYHLKGDFSYQYSYMGIEKPRPPQGEQVDNKYTASDCLRECWYEAMRERLTGTLAYSFYENADLDGRPPVDSASAGGSADSRIFGDRRLGNGGRRRPSNLSSLKRERPRAAAAIR